MIERFDPLKGEMLRVLDETGVAAGDLEPRLEAEDLKIVCPCNFLVHETYKGKEDGECWCGLFIRRK